MPNYPNGKYYCGYSWFGPYEEPYGKARILRFPVIPRGKGRGWELAIHYLSWVIAGCVRVLWLRPKHWDRIFVFQTSPVTSAIPAFLARMLSQAPVVIWVQDLWPEAVTSSGLFPGGALTGGLGRFSRWVYRSCDRVVTQSQAYAGLLVDRGVSSHRVAYIPNWAEDFYVGEQSTRDSHCNAGSFSILFAGNMGRGQGMETVLAAILHTAEHPHIHWTFVGEGALRPWLERQVEDLGLAGRVTFLSARLPEHMPDLFRDADALLVSLRKDPVYTMTVPGKLQSYLAAGKPVLGCIDGEGARIIQESGAGLVARAEDAEDLATQALVLSRMDPAVRDAMGARGRTWFQEHFSRDLCIRALEAQICIGDVGLASGE